MTGRASIPVFDVGGVLLDWDRRHLFAKLIDDAGELDWFLDHVCTTSWNLQMDAGLSFADGVAALTARFPDHADLIRAFDERWPETVRDVIHDSVAILNVLLDRGGPVYAITNFSAEKFTIAAELWPFLARFDGVVVSGAVRLVKPDAAIYGCLLDDHGLAAADCLFIDDVADNVAGARAVGMHAHHFTGADRLRQALQDHGIL